MKAQGPHYRVGFRRRREGRTDYRLRARILRGGKPRAVVRKTLNQVIVQIVEMDPAGDRILATATSRELVKQGWAAGTGNVPAAYLTGFLAGRRAAACSRPSKASSTRASPCPTAPRSSPRRSGSAGSTSARRFPSPSMT